MTKHTVLRIASDPFALLAIIFSALLIHDIDHRGVGNARLIKEELEMSTAYRNESIAEQNTLDVAWDILMRHKYCIVPYKTACSETKTR
jgi:hypothetical protein